MDRNTITEGASHFSVSETLIFQENIEGVKSDVFSQYYTPSMVNEPETYIKSIHCFASGRKRIADLCVRNNLLDPSEAALFSTYRSENALNRFNVYKTPLKSEDNTFFYELAMERFKKGSILIESSLGTFSNNIQHVRSAQFEKLRKIFNELLNKPIYNSQDLLMMENPLSSEVYCYQSLLATESSVKLFSKYTELGHIITVKSGSTAIALNPDVTFSTLRFTLTIDGQETKIGSLNCLSLPKDSSYQYYPLFVIDHCRSNHVESLISLAEQYWIQALRWNKSDGSTYFIQNLAKVFYLQTIAVPYARGSESNAKAQIECIARYHGEELVFSTKLAFRMPFILSPDEFTHYFQKHVYFKSELEQMID